MKKYRRMNANNEHIDVSLDVVLGDAVLELVESGIDEDAHWRGYWHSIDNDDLEFALKTPEIQTCLMEYIRPALMDQLRQVLKSRREHK